LLARWRAAATDDEKHRLAGEIQTLLLAGAPADRKSPDHALYRQLTSLSGPLFARPRPALVAAQAGRAAEPDDARFGLDPARFGRHSNGQPIDNASLCVQAPAVLEVHLPADLVEGWEFVTSGSLHAETAAEGSVQLQSGTGKPAALAGLT